MRFKDKASAERTFHDLWGRVPVNEDGGIPYPQYFAIDDHIPILLSFIDIGDQITPNEAVGIFYSAFHKLRRENNPDFIEFERIIKADISGILIRPLQSYYMTSTVSFDRLSRAAYRTRTIGRSKVAIGAEYPKKLQTQTWFMSGFGDVNHTEPVRYARLWSGTRARTEQQAAHHMLNDIELLIAMYNVVLGRTRPSILVGKKRPLNKVRLGPIQLLHSRTGAVDPNRVFYEPDFRDEIEPYRLDVVPKQMDACLKGFCWTLKHSPIGDIIDKSIRQYNAAMSNHDESLCLIRLWSCLEILTGTTRAETKDTVRRASFFSKDYDYRRRKLALIADLRNSYVHSGTEITMVDHLVMDLKVYVAELIMTLVFGDRKFETQEQYLQVLDLPSRVDDLRKRIKVAKLGIRMRDTR
jgi:hypothetical protein